MNYILNTEEAAQMLCNEIYVYLVSLEPDNTKHWQTTTKWDDPEYRELDGKWLVQYSDKYGNPDNYEVEA